MSENEYDSILEFRQKNKLLKAILFQVSVNA